MCFRLISFVAYSFQAENSSLLNHRVRIGSASYLKVVVGSSMHWRLVRRPNESPHLCLQIDIRLASAFHKRLAESSAVFFRFVTGVSEALQLSIPKMSDRFGNSHRLLFEINDPLDFPGGGIGLR